MDIKASAAVSGANPRQAASHKIAPLPTATAAVSAPSQARSTDAAVVSIGSKVQSDLKLLNRVEPEPLTQADSKLSEVSEVFGRIRDLAV